MRSMALIGVLLLLSELALAQEVLVSNATIGREIFVLVQGNASTDFSGEIVVTRPDGSNFTLALVNGQARFNASRLGLWKISYGNGSFFSIVSDESPPPEAQPQEMAKKGWWSGLEFPLLILIFAIPLAALLLFLFNLTRRGVIFRKYRKNGKVLIEVENRLGELREVRVVDFEGGRKFEWRKDALPKGGKLLFSREQETGGEGKPNELGAGLEEGKPALLKARWNEEEIELKSESGEEKKAGFFRALSFAGAQPFTRRPSAKATRALRREQGISG